MSPRFFCRLTLLVAALILSGCASRKSTAPSERERIRPSSAHTTLNLITEGPQGKSIFRKYGGRRYSQYADNWTWRVDLTGIAWDQRQAGVLVSPNHVLFSQHHQRKIGSVLIFHDRTGYPHLRRLVRKVSLPGDLDPDITVGLLDRPAPVSFYKVLPVGSDWHTHLRGATALVTDSQRQMHVKEIGGVAWRRLVFKGPSPLLPEYYHENLVRGDSGHPSFILLNKEPVLLSTHTFGGSGAGPFFSEPRNFAEINNAMRQLGPGDQLTVISLTPSGKQPQG